MKWLSFLTYTKVFRCCIFTVEIGIFNHLMPKLYWKHFVTSLHLPSSKGPRVYLAIRPAFHHRDSNWRVSKQRCHPNDIFLSSRPFRRTRNIFLGNQKFLGYFQLYAAVLDRFQSSLFFEISNLHVLETRSRNNCQIFY